MYANSIGAKFSSCSGQDSDGDGYVTCGYIPPTAKQGEPPRQILCSYSSPGCKEKSV